jgi:histidine ammonia-lyase
MSKAASSSISVGDRDLTIEDVVSLSKGSARIALPKSPQWRRRIEDGFALIERRIEAGAVVYGVNTGYGDSCKRAVPAHLFRELPLNLTRYHGCGTGEEFSPEITAAILTARITSLARGFSGVRVVLLERLCSLLNERVLPLIPQEGSVGASGDLTPLSYVAAVLVGEHEVLYRSQRMAAMEALALAHIEPISLAPKEALAIMNGTAAMTGLACLAFARAEHLLELSSRISAMSVLALRGNPAHFDERLFQLKPHPGQMRAAAVIRDSLRDARWARKDAADPIQDPYSLRCAPHVLGVLGDTLPWIRQLVETELNSANDNPLLDPEQDLVLHGGHFYGGHIAIAMDTLKTAVANIADLLDRQFALLVDVRTNRGLSANLSSAPPERASVNHGLKAVQIASSAWTAEALKLCMPASVFSRSTECHNQDKVSMGTISARDAVRVLELTEQVVAAMLLAVVEGLGQRLASGELERASLSPEIEALFSSAREDFSPLVEDRRLDGTLRRIMERIHAYDFALAAPGKKHGAVLAPEGST